MDLVRLRTLQELSVRATMADVAEALSLTPSAVSQHITHLEGLTGVSLAERSGRSVRLTHEGKILAAYATRAASVLDEATAEMAALRGETSGEIRIAAFSSVAAALLPRTMLALGKSHPKVRLVLEELDSVDGLAALRSWKVDVAIIDDLTVSKSEIDGSLHSTKLVEDTLKIVMAKSHRLAERRNIVLSELSQDAWALDAASNPYSRFVKGICREAGFEAVVNGYSSNLYVLLALIRSGCSISILPSLSLPAHLREFRMLNLQPVIRRNVFTVCRAAGKKHPAVQALIKVLKQQAADLT